jgi:hypothetical protein
MGRDLKRFIWTGWKRFTIWTAGCAVWGLILGVSASLYPDASLMQNLWADTAVAAYPGLVLGGLLGLIVGWW